MASGSSSLKSKKKSTVGTKIAALLKTPSVIFFLFVYAVLLSWVYSTIGQPYRDFLLKAESQGFAVMEGQERLRAEAAMKFGDLDDPERVDADKIKGWMGWVGMDIEEYDEAKKKAARQSVIDSLPKNQRVPPKYTPSFWPCLATGVAAVAHALLLLMQHWSTAFNCRVNYAPLAMSSLTQISATTYKNAPTHIRVRPATGKDVLVPCVVLDGLGPTFEYHRRRYVYDSESMSWQKIRCATTMPTSLFSTWTGFSDEGHVEAARVRFGENEFNVRQPDFVDLYKKQLLSPLCVFQLFSVLLWCLDEYWQYSLFTLFMILMFEGTVVFQRLKSLGALKGMGNKIRDVYVFREGNWTLTTTNMLLPGDIMSLTKTKEQGEDVVPADVLLLNGSSVVSEASLTGESVPQMKERIADLSDDDNLAIKTKHKSHVLYAGTTMLQVKAGADDVLEAIGNPPDGGCICFVLRTGFTSAQGKLVRMIEGSQDKVKGHEVETALLLLLLFFFALASSGYVLNEGMKSDTRSKYELLLHCILIITSVIPPELPMQTALAVNNSLMTLMKLQIFCTEPFRVPVAGKIDSCLFDKTGTLTTDELVAVGIWTGGSKDELKAMTKVDDAAGFVLAGCNSLIFIDGETTGDPLESAALKAMRWQVNEVEEKDTKMIPKAKTDKHEAGKHFVVSGTPVSSVTVLQRHHFSSKLQRMSTVVRDGSGRTFVVCKGSPEAIGERILNKHSKYNEQSMSMAKKGLRVIALGFKRVDNAQQLELMMSSRDLCECELTFAGFIAFTCRVRKDTKQVLGALKRGGMSVTMVTGDALLTAAHVAKDVGICTKDERILILEKGEDGNMFWKRYTDESVHSPYVASEVPKLAGSQGFELSATGKSIAAAYEYDCETKNTLWYYKIFARMSPDAKETVIENLHGVGHLCLMCGDGANDVGALKQADVGVALLSGFGDLNVDKGEDAAKKTNVQAGPTALISAQELDRIRALHVKDIKAKIRELGTDPDKYAITDKGDLVNLYRKVSMQVAVKSHDAKNALDAKKQKALDNKKTQQQKMAEKQAKIAIRVKELEDAGESWAQFKAMKEFMAEEMAEANKKKAEMRKNAGVANSAARMAAQLEDGMEDGELPMVKIGDASIAAPFTSKMPSIRSCVDIVRQGRCTLVTTLQMYQILALNCLISSYSLSVLYLDGVKYGDTQMTAMGILMSVSFMSVSRAKPLNELSPVRPLTSIFHPSSFGSLLGQFVVHLVTMYTAVQAAKEHLPPDWKVELEGEFKPGIVNSVVFLVSNVQQVTVFVVNLKGRPFMNGLTENKPLLYSLAATFILTFMFASETMPGLNKYFQLVPFPTEDFRNWILKLLAGDVLVSLLWDRLMQFLFARQILFASMEGTTMKDVFALLRTVGTIGMLLYFLVGDDEQWTEMMMEEGRYEELGLNASDYVNGTNATNATVFGGGDAVADAASTAGEL